MHRPWTPEHVVTPDLARTLIELQFPAIAPARVRPLADGWDNTAMLVNDAWVFRFPRRTVAVGCLEAELRVLPRLAGGRTRRVRRGLRHGRRRHVAAGPLAGS